MDTNKKQQRVLIADDEATIRALLRDKLEQEGYVVSEAATGEECIRVFKEELPAIVITDIMMPHTNGEDVVRVIKKFAPATIAIVLTGFGTMESIQRMMAAGCDGYLLKPITDLNSLNLAIIQAQERQRMLVRNAMLRKHSRSQSEAINSLLEAILLPLTQLQENLVAMRTALKEDDLGELEELLGMAET